MLYVEFSIREDDFVLVRSSAVLTRTHFQGDFHARQEGLMYFEWVFASNSCSLFSFFKIFVERGTFCIFTSEFLF